VSKGSGGAKVMVAGVGGASLGTEVMKALRLAGRYRVFGCDISSTAYGLYEEGFERTFLVERDNYVASVLEACATVGAEFLVPGGEQPMVLLSADREQLSQAGVLLLGNGREVIDVFSDKAATFERLAALGVPVPATRVITSESDIEAVGIPCIVKPATGSGGSNAVFFAPTPAEAMMYAAFIRRMGIEPVAQQYVGIDEGEFTIGVLSFPDKTTYGSIALRRALDAKLSVSHRGRGGVISSGYSQGYIDIFSELCAQAEKISQAIGSRGPINVQGRVRDGVLLPFEINPRFSASSYLRAMAGFNEVDVLIQYHLTGEIPRQRVIRPGWYLRSLAESYVPADEVKA
jgi:carbamoyl-phosphate synthase large subunit